MAEYQLSRTADADVARIAIHSLRQWGRGQALAYSLRLHQALQNLAEFPHVGRDASRIRPGLMRMEHDQHVIFYRPMVDGVLIWRILHRRMWPGYHL